MVREELFLYDEARRQAMGDGCLLCGVDEAGRGPLAGPVCCAAVVLKPGVRIDGLNDSKKIAEKKRDAVLRQVLDNALYCGIALVDSETIDRINILQATLQGMVRAVSRLAVLPTHVLVDGNIVPSGLPCPAEAVKKGDATSASIAAASILAKVTRDRYMRWLDVRYPQYGFAKHKGYGTPQHYAAIERFGVIPMHRTTFLKGRVEI